MRYTRDIRVARPLGQLALFAPAILPAQSTHRASGGRLDLTPFLYFLVFA